MFGLEWYQYMLITVVSANILFLGVGGAIHYHYYHKKRHLDKQWKMQPGKYLSDKLAKHAVFWGTLNMNIASAAFGFLGWGVLEHGWSQIYFDINEYSYGWAALSVFLAFLVIEASAYYIHAAIHNPFLYKHIHQMHHYYTAPNYFTISAMHPLEWIIHASYVIAPAFLFPMHWSLYLFVMMTTFFYGFWDHSGIKLGFNLPFHGCNKFHDDHHKYFHVNFGFLTPIFDRIHNTVRREGHHYTELTFQGGQGRVKLDELGDRAIGPWVDYDSSWNEKDQQQ
jgi:Delta7-sterol 5-desaturase